MSKYRAAVINGLIDGMVEMERCKKLSNDALVDELLSRLPFTELDYLVEELCTRLSPDWQARADAHAALLDRSAQKGEGT